MATWQVVPFWSGGIWQYNRGFELFVTDQSEHGMTGPGHHALDDTVVGCNGRTWTHRRGHMQVTEANRCLLINSL